MLPLSTSAIFAISLVMPVLAQQGQYPIVSDPKELQAIKFCNEWADSKKIHREEVVPRKVESTGKWECAICVGVVCKY
jgi:hypothetical protein